MDVACSERCDSPKQVVAAPAPRPTYQSIDCTFPERNKRICRSCCDPVMSTTSYCQEIYQNQTKTIGSICWYCCSETMEVDPVVLAVTASPITQDPAQPSFPYPVSDNVSSEPSAAPSNTNVSQPGDRRRRLCVQRGECSCSREQMKEATDMLLPSGIWASELAMDYEN